MAKKLALIDPDLLLRIINEISSDQRPTMPTEPNLREMGQMRDKMNDYLQDSDMDNETALHGYNSALQRYLTHFGKIDKKGVTQPPPGTGPLAGSVSALTTDPHRINPGHPPGDEFGNKSHDSSGSVQATGTPSGPIASAILTSLPKTAQRKGALLLNHIRSNPDHISWTSDGKLKIKDEIIADTNITDLIHDSVRNRPTALPPAGFEKFTEALRATNVPSEAIANKTRLAMIKGSELWQLPRSTQVNRSVADFLKSTATKKNTKRQSGPRPGLRKGIKRKNWEGYIWMNIDRYIFIKQRPCDRGPHCVLRCGWGKEGRTLVMAKRQKKQNKTKQNKTNLNKSMMLYWKKYILMSDSLGHSVARVPCIEQWRGKSRVITSQLGFAVNLAIRFIEELAVCIGSPDALLLCGQVIHNGRRIWCL